MRHPGSNHFTHEPLHTRPRDGANIHFWCSVFVILRTWPIIAPHLFFILKNRILTTDSITKYTAHNNEELYAWPWCGDASLPVDNNNNNTNRNYRTIILRWSVVIILSPHWRPPHPFVSDDWIILCPTRRRHFPCGCVRDDVTEPRPTAAGDKQHLRSLDTA